LRFAEPLRAMPPAQARVIAAMRGAIATASHRAVARFAAAGELPRRGTASKRGRTFVRLGTARLSARPALPTLCATKRCGRGPDEASMLSPCIKVCSIEPATGLCAGCARTLAEIAAWGGLSEAERVRIMLRLPARRGQAGPRLDASLAGEG
jgi:predicted Fe-S protein YdhL (DUF1289 family)